MKQSIGSIISGYKRHGTLEQVEFLYVILTSFVFGFIFSFRKWGDAAGNYDPIQGISNWIFYSIFSFLGIFILHLGIRMSAVTMGYKPNFVVWKSGLVANLFVTFLTNGMAIFLSPGGFELRQIPGMKLGRLRQGISYTERSTAVFWGFFAISIYAALAKIIFSEVLNSPTFAAEMILVAYVIALWSLFPVDIPLRIWVKTIPLSNGTTLIYGGLSKAVWTISYLAFSFGLLMVFTGLVSIILAILLSGIAYLLFFLYLDPQKEVYAKFKGKK